MNLIVNASTIIVASLFALLMVDAPEVRSETLVEEANALAKQFGASLKPQLKKALAEGGPVAAIEVCSKKAPEIAASLSEQSGWEVRRVSLKPRNATTAIADDWEQATLRDLEARQANNDGSDMLIHSEVVAGEFRFMKAQVVEAVCIACHGSNIAPEIKEALSRNYPDDIAVGYQLGDVRGAISLRTNSDAPSVSFD